MLDELQYIKPNLSFSVEKLRVTTDFERDFTGLMLPFPTTTLIIKELRQKVATPFLFYNLNLINSDQLKRAVIKKNSRTFVVPS